MIYISFRCIYNCHIGRERIIYYDRLELDLNFPTGTDTEYFVYSWSVSQWNETKGPFIKPDKAIFTETGKFNFKVTFSYLVFVLFSSVFFDLWLFSILWRDKTLFYKLCIFNQTRNIKSRVWEKKVQKLHSRYILING